MLLNTITLGAKIQYMNFRERTRGVAQVIEHMYHKGEALRGMNE
jgi:hypothetical protein